MRGIARVSAVFLLVSAIWVCGVWGDAADRRGASAQVPETKEKVGVGTKTGTEGEKVRGVTGDQDAVIAEPRVVFREVEKGWSDGTPEPFKRYLGKGKVRLDFGEGGPRDGLYSRSQAYYLIADYLKRTPTLSIGSVRMSEEGRKDSGPYAVLERTYRYKTGPSGKEVIFVLLTLEDSRWVISQMRAVPAR
jgi:hypothetical protein